MHDLFGNINSKSFRITLHAVTDVLLSCDKVRYKQLSSLQKCWSHNSLIWLVAKIYSHAYMSLIFLQNTHTGVIYLVIFKTPSHWYLHDNLLPRKLGTRILDVYTILTLGSNPSFLSVSDDSGVFCDLCFNSFFLKMW